MPAGLASEALNEDQGPCFALRTWVPLRLTSANCSEVEGSSCWLALNSHSSGPDCSLSSTADLVQLPEAVLAVSVLHKQPDQPGTAPCGLDSIYMLHLKYLLLTG